MCLSIRLSFYSISVNSDLLTVYNYLISSEDYSSWRLILSNCFLICYYVYCFLLTVYSISYFIEINSFVLSSFYVINLLFYCYKLLTLNYFYPNNLSSYFILSTNYLFSSTKCLFWIFIYIMISFFYFYILYTYTYIIYSFYFFSFTYCYSYFITLNISSLFLNNSLFDCFYFYNI